MVTVKGGTAVRRYIEQIPQQLVEKVLPGAGRAAGRIVADEAKSRSISKEVGDALVVKVTRKDPRLLVSITIPFGWAYSVGLWLERGTSAHFISVDGGKNGGSTAARINRMDKEAAEDGRDGPGASLVINGKFVGGTVYHPGMRAHPFLRPALDTKADEAIAAAQSYINTRVARMRRTGVADGEGTDE